MILCVTERRMSLISETTFDFHAYQGLLVEYAIYMKGAVSESLLLNIDTRRVNAL